MIQIFKKNWGIITLLAIVLFLIAINIHPNMMIIGLDNASPYFDPSIVLERIKGTSSIIYGGIVFQLPFISALYNLNLSPEIISNTYVFSNFLMGILGMFFVLKSISKKQLTPLIGSLVLISSMLTFWIFTQPNFLFISAYGSVPFLIYFLGKETKRYYDWIFLIIFSISFLTVSLNIVALGMYIIQVIASTKIIYTKTSWKFLAVWLLSIVLFWLGTLQVIQIMNGDTTFILFNIFKYIEELLSNPFMPTVTKDIIASEKTNSLLHTLSFSLGWTELHDVDNIPVFEQYGLYRENISYILMGIVPSLFALMAIFIKKEKRIIFLTILFIFFILISSKYGITIIESVPYLSSALRWASSKLWPIYIVPLVILSSYTVEKVLEGKNMLLKYSIPFVLLITMAIYSYPVLNGNLLSSKTLVNIPNEYLEIPQDSAILILPEPQKLYMREYDWGYYGSDFISYLNSSKVVDAANLYETSYIYQDVLESRVVPDDIEYVVYDRSVQTEEQYSDVLDGFVLINSNKYFDIYGRE